MTFSRYFGGAGFNRHLLHHLDPSISYTRFDEFERFKNTVQMTTLKGDECIPVKFFKIINYKAMNASASVFRFVKKIGPD